MQALAAVQDSESPTEWTEEKKKIIRDQFAPGATNAEFAALLETARVRGLDPFQKEIFFVKRYDSMRRCEVWATQVSIDGLRVIAERSGQYDGSDEPEWTEDANGRVTKCVVRVHRKDHTRPAVGVAFFSEYVQTTKEGKPTRFWAQMPHVMIAKCAEALAIRKGFPRQTAGLYTREEMGQADSGRVTYDGEVIEEQKPRPVAAVRSIDGTPPAPALAAPKTNTLADELRLVSEEMEAAKDAGALNFAASKVNALKPYGLTESQRAQMMRLYSERKTALAKPVAAHADVASDPDGTELGHELDAPHMREPGEEG